MISRPTTDQVLLDCARELMASVLPAVSDPNVQVQVVMIDSVLRSMAVRSAHEIAWMTDETAQALDYARAVARVEPDVRLLAELDAAARPAAGLHLDEVVDAYCRTARALSTALELAVAGGHGELIARGEALLELRGGNETAVMAGWSPTGR